MVFTLLVNFLLKRIFSQMLASATTNVVLNLKLIQFPQFHWKTLIYLTSILYTLIWTGNSNRRGRLSTVYLLVKVACIVKKAIISSIHKLAYPNKLVKGGQLYSSYPFSKASLVWIIINVFKATHSSSSNITCNDILRMNTSEPICDEKDLLKNRTPCYETFLSTIYQFL